MEALIRLIMLENNTRNAAVVGLSERAEIVEGVRLRSMIRPNGGNVSSPRR